MIVQQFIKAFKIARKRNWYRIYVAVDIHDTILKASYDKKETFAFYPFAKKALQEITMYPEVCMILWSCSTDEKLEEYRDEFDKHDILFEYMNDNPECLNNSYGCFDKKMYMNVGLDDKFGFNPYIDWFLIYLYFKIFKPHIKAKLDS